MSLGVDLISFFGRCSWLLPCSSDGDGSAVRLPGDLEREVMADRKANGVPVDRNTWEHVLAAAESVGLSRAAVAGML